MSITGLFQKAVNIIPFRFRNSIKHIPVIKELQAFLLKRFVNSKEFIATITAINAVIIVITTIVTSRDTSRVFITIVINIVNVITFTAIPFRIDGRLVLQIINFIIIDFIVKNSNQ